MKKIIALLLALCALAALTVSAFASASSEPASTETVETAAAEETQTAIAAALSEDEAVAAALKDAGENEADVTVTKCRLSEKTTEAGETVAVYTIKFETGTTEYKYRIDGSTGAIIYKSVEFENPDYAFTSRSRSASAADNAASAEAGGEMDTDSRSAAESGRSGRSGHKSASSEPDGADVLTDAAAL